MEADGPLGKFVQFVRGGSSTSASSSQLSQARIQLLDSINFRNLKGTTNEDRLRRVFEQHQIDLEDLPYIRNKLTPQQRGVLGEVLMERRMAALGYEQLPTKVGGNRNNGIDGLFIMRNDRGEIEHIVVVESKWDTSKYGWANYYNPADPAYNPSTAKGGPARRVRQMSREWIDQKAREMQAESDFATQEAGDLLEAALDDIPYQGMYSPNGQQMSKTMIDTRGFRDRRPDQGHHQWREEWTTDPQKSGLVNSRAPRAP